MPRLARLVLPGLPHHITQRGTNRQDLFFTPQHDALQGPSRSPDLWAPAATRRPEADR